MATRTIATDIKLTGEKEFNDGMKAMNSNLKVLRSDMAAVSAEYADNADSVKALTAKNKILQESVDQQKAKVDALRLMYEKVTDVYGENSAQADKWKQQLNQATVALHKDTEALEKNAEALRGKYLAGLEKLSGGAKSAFKGLGTAAATTAKGVGIVTAAASAGVAALGAAGVAGLGIMVGYAKEAAEAAKAAKEAGEELTATQEQWLAFSGQLDTLDASVASAKSALGGILLPMLGELSTEGAAFLNDFSKEMEAAAGDAGKQGQIMSQYIVKGAEMIKEALPEIIQLGKDLIGGLGEGLSESGPELLDMGVELVFDLLDMIIEYAPELAQAGITLVEKLVASLGEQGPELMTSAIGMVSEIAMGLAQAAPDLIPAATNLVMKLLLALVDASPQLLEAGLQLVFGIISGILGSIPELIGTADQLIEKIITAFSESDSEFLQIGSNILKGIWTGIKNGTEWLYNLISGWIDGVVGWMKDKLDINSPSRRVEDEVGYQTGIAVGTGALKAQSAVKKMWGNFLDSTFTIPDLNFNSRLAVAGTGAEATFGSKTVNLYFNAKSITEADIRMVIDIVNRELGDAM